ncbi:MAG: hypothetical protein KF878_32430 [Planctomycetes bacterium]|nr:hypothetical protein [Planctomycetota bacterium]
MSTVPARDSGPRFVDEAVERLAPVSTVPGLDVGPRSDDERSSGWRP